MKEIIGLIIIFITFQVFGQNPIFIPDTISGPNYNLMVHEDSVQFFTGKISHTYAFNNNHYLGPTLIFKNGEDVNISVNNLLPDTTTVHWHGIHLPAIWDGGPYTPILPGSTWHPKFTIKDNAATYWYHPHLHMKTAEQAIKGAAGLIIVRDSNESTLQLPRNYGKDDFPIIIQCQQYDSFNQAMPRGMLDSTLLVNGTLNPYLNAPAQIIRLRMLNASGERTFNFGLTNNRTFYQIASDGGLLDQPYQTTRLRLAPGERAEILIDLNGLNGTSINLICFGSELPMGIQGGPTMPMPAGSPDMNSPLNGIDYPILKINVVPQLSNAITSIPNILTSNKVIPESMATTNRTIRFTADSLMVMDGPFYFNDSTFDMMRIDYRIPKNNVEIWTLVNETMVAHPFHIHDVQFFILDRNGLPPQPNEAGRKDVVLVPPGDSIRFITRFTDFTDSVIPYMFHCHILMHEDDGMMGSFLVVDENSSTNEPAFTKTIKIFPNPTNNLLNILFQNKIPTAEVKIIDALGKIILSGNLSESNAFAVDVSTLGKGCYFIEVNLPNNIYHQKFIKN